MNSAFTIVSSWSKTFGARQAKSKEEERNKRGKFGCYLEQAVRLSFRNKDGSFQCQRTDATEIDQLHSLSANPGRDLTHSTENLVEFQLVVQF